MVFDGMDYVNCINEQQFKMLYIKNVLSKTSRNIFCIETEETVKGFPDVLCVDNKTGLPLFYEFKIANHYVAKFQPTQPAFYKAHPDLNIKVVILDKKRNSVNVFPVKRLFEKDCPYALTSRGEVRL